MEFLIYSLFGALGGVIFLVTTNLTFQWIKQTYNIDCMDDWFVIHKRSTTNRDEWYVSQTGLVTSLLFTILGTMGTFIALVFAFGTGLTIFTLTIINKLR